jgi:hypothetical protein
MDHPNTRTLARYALGEITDEAELDAFEEHLLGCEQCRRRAVAVDLIGAAPTDANDQLSLHIAARGDETPVALCGDKESRNIISEVLLPGLNVNVLCPKCLALLRGGAGQRIH